VATLALALVQANTFWSAVLVAAGTYIDQNYLFPQKIKGSKLQDLKIQTSTYGNAIAKVRGGARVAGNLIWGTKFVEHKKTSRQGGKGGGAKVTEYSYSVSFAVSICKGPISSIGRVWAAGKPFPLFESKYSLNGFASELGEIVSAFPGLRYTQMVQVTDIDSEVSSSWVLTAKNVDDMQVLSVKDSEGNEYEDCHFGIYYNNGYVRFTVSKTTDSTVIPDGTLFKLIVEPRVAKYEFTLHTGTESQMPDSFIEAIEGVGNVPAYRGQAYMVFQNLYIDEWRSVPNLTFEINSGSNDLKDIIEDISVNESGINLDFVDATDLDGLTITGQSIEREASGRDQIEPLMTAYLFDGIEQDGKVVFSRRHADNALIIPYEDLGAHEGDEQTEPLTIIRADESELPRSVAVKYTSADWDYQEQSMQSKRQLVKAKSDISIDSGLVMTDSEAQELADAKLYEQWINRDSYETSLPMKYTDVVPGMVVKFTDEFGNLYPAVIAQSTFGKPGLNKISAIAIDGVIYNKATRAVDPSTGAGDDQPSTGVIFEFLDLPHLPIDPTTTNNIYYAATGQNYQGTNIYKTDDGGNTYDVVAQFAAQSTMGYAINVLPAGTTSDWDTANTVDVVLISGTLESRPENDILNGFNAAVIGNEVIQFTTATLIDDSTYRLSGLLRGKLGTDGYVSSHGSGDRFILLKAGTIGVLPTTDLNVEKTYRVGPAMQSVDDMTYTEIKFTYTKGWLNSSYTFTQSTASTVWTINHDLNKNPIVVCVDTSGNSAVGTVSYTSLNSLTVTFSVALSGSAYLT
jgi:hypothetical protein